MLGLSIGNYKITAQIGEGGMGVVYRAVHESLGRSAAVKVLLPTISNGRDVVTRFFNEARSAASIHHPGIVDIFDFGFLPDGRAYIIMEFLEGESLAGRLRRFGRMPHGRALQVARSVARALHAAHEGGIVHRDMKPDNIFLVPDPEMPTGERIKLLDFGIAKLGGGPAEAALTQTGAVMGTPTYMAPEQCRGAGSVDRRADLYALGCILFELLCGRPPFVAEGAGDIIAHHLYFPPESPRIHDASITPAIEALVLGLLQKDPAHRPATAAQVATMIDALDVPTTATAPSLPGGAASMTLGAAVTTISSAVGTSAGNLAPAPSRRWMAILGGAAAATVVGLIAIVAIAGDRNPAASGSPPATPATMPEPATAHTASSAPPTPAVAAPTATPAVPAPAPTAAPAFAAPATGTPEPIAPAAVAKPDAAAAVAAPARSAPAPTAAAAPNQRARPEHATSPSPTAMSERATKSETATGHGHRDKHASDAKPQVAPTARPDGACNRGAFSAVVQAEHPDEATVQAALGRLKRCQGELAADVYADLQQQLISKL